MLMNEIDAFYILMIILQKNNLETLNFVDFDEIYLIWG